MIDFWASWFTPCISTFSLFQDLSVDVRFAHLGLYAVDVDVLKDVAQEVGIKELPTFAVYKNGAKIDEVTGSHPPLENLLLKNSG